ncbi:ABC transporter G family member 37 [Hordeum vulgare]|nr:ABC transporter G family member 37 [Hordeum vulgare]
MSSSDNFSDSDDYDGSDIDYDEELTLRTALERFKVEICVSSGSGARTPFVVEVHKRHGPSDRVCPICGTIEESNHIFFTCVTAQFLWSYLREAINGR